MIASSTSRDNKSRLLDGNAAASIVKRAVTRSKIDIAVAFWGEGAVKKLGLSKARGGRIICNLLSGASFPAEIRKLIALKQFKVRMLSKLHAKAYIGSDQIILGSSNASTNGMSENNEGWIELNVQISQKSLRAEAGFWFEKVWKQAVAIGEADLLRAEEIWNAKAKASAAMGTNAKTLSDVLRDRPELTRENNIYFALFNEQTSEETIAQGENSDVPEAIDDKSWYYDYFENIPESAVIVDILNGRIEAVSRTGPHVPSFKLRDGARCWIAYTEKGLRIQIDGLGRIAIDSGFRAVVGKNWDALWKRARGNSDCRILSLKQAFPLLFPRANLRTGEIS
jgi:HKD family nuclease